MEKIYKVLGVRNQEIVEKGKIIREDLTELIKKYDGIMSGYISINSPDHPDEFELHNIVFINRRTTFKELALLTDLLRLVDELNASTDIDMKLKRGIIRCPNKKCVNIILNYYAHSILEEKYHWSIKVYEKYNTTYVPIVKEDYTYKFVKLRKKNSTQQYILLNKYFIAFNNGDNIYFIDFGKIGDRIFTVDKMDFLFITHSHIDHIGSFIAKKNMHLKPFIYSNLPTLELLRLRKTDFDMRDDIDELYHRAYVNSKIYFDDLYAEQFLSGHAYGSNFYIENYAQGFSALYITDTNIRSRAFKSKSIKSIGRYDADVLFIEFPLHKYKPVKIPTKHKYIIGTTSGEYEEVLVRIPREAIKMVDINNSMYYYELIRRKYKSYLSKDLVNIEVVPGEFEEFLKSDAKYFFTTKGYALMYWKKYGNILNKYGIKVYLTNTKTNVDGVKILPIKTHINYHETMKLISEVRPKAVIFTHYNGSNLLYKVIPEVEKILGTGSVYTSNPEGEWVKIAFE